MCTLAKQCQTALLQSGNLRSSDSVGCYFQQAFGYPENDLPNLLESALKFSGLSTKSWNYLHQFSSACTEDAIALEKEIGLDKLSQEDKCFLRECGSLTTDPTLSSHHLLTLYTQHAHLLEQPHYRTLLLTQLFKTGPSGKNILQEAIDSDKIAITEKICTFAETLETLAFQVKNEPDHQLFLYATHILSSIAQYYSPEALPGPLDLLFKHQLRQLDNGIIVLQQKKEDEGAERLYRLHKLYALTQMGLDDTNLVEAFGHYFALCTFLTPEGQPHFLMEYSAHSVIQDHLKNLSGKSEEFLKKMVVSIAKAVKFDAVISVKEVKLDETYAVLSCKDTRGNKVAVHCTTGNIFHNGELLKRSGDFNKETKEYDFLFGSKTYPVRSTGATQYLDHPAGMFRLQGGQITFLPKGHKDWVIYCPADQTDLKIPLFLKTGYRHFYNPKTEQWTLVKGRDYQLFNTSLTWKISDQVIYSYDKNIQYSLVECPELERIERPDCIVKKFDRGRISLELPRYDLTFVAEDGKLKWTKNQSYYLVENKLLPGTLCVQEQSLLLQSDQGQKMLLVPRFPIMARKGFRKEGRSIFPNDEKDPKFDWKAPLPQEKYSCFHLSMETEWKTTCIEDTLTLAYYSLQDRDFERFKTLLKTISPCDTWSKESFEILQWILAYGEKQQHCSPEVHASILRAAIFYFYVTKHDPSLELSNDEKEVIQEKLDNCASAYLTTRTHIDHNLRLSQDEEGCISQDIPGVFERHLERYEKDFSLAGILIANGLSIDIPPQHSKFGSAVGFRDYDSALPTIMNPMQDNAEGFFPIYQAIFSDDFCVQQIETSLLIQRSMKDFPRLLDLAFCCLEAKRQQPKAVFPPTTSYDFNARLNNVIKGTSYKIADSNNTPIESADLQNYFAKTQKKHSPLVYYPVDLSIHMQTIEPVWKAAGLMKKKCSIPSMTPLSIQVAAEFEENADDHYIATEMDKVNEEIKEGNKRLANTRRMTEIGRSYGDPADLIEVLTKQIEIHQMEGPLTKKSC